MVQGQMTQIFYESFSFSHSVKSTGIDHIAVFADSNNEMY